jgi:cysteinyl-tRNA synthetase
MAGMDHPSAVLRQAPYGFQENASDISARAAQDGVSDPCHRLRPAVEPLVTPRATLRRQGSYPAVDAIRGALTAAGLEQPGTPDGTRWEPDPPASPAGRLRTGQA